MQESHFQDGNLFFHTTLKPKARAELWQMINKIFPNLINN